MASGATTSPSLTEDWSIVTWSALGGDTQSVSSVLVLLSLSPIQVPGDYFLKPLLREFEFTPPSAVRESV